MYKIKVFPTAPVGDSDVAIRTKSIVRDIKYADSTNYVKYNGKNYPVHYLDDDYYNDRYICLDEDWKWSKPFSTNFTDRQALAHAWAHQTQPEGSFRNSQMYFIGTSIHSYGSHFEIARLLKVPGQENPVVLFNNSYYSRTTNEHVYAVRAAIPHDWVRITAEFDSSSSYYYRDEVTMFDYDTNKNNYDAYMNVLDQYVKKIEELVEDLPKRRAVLTIRHDIQGIEEYLDKIRLFVETFRCKSILPKRIKDLLTATVEDISPVAKEKLAHYKKLEDSRAFRSAMAKARRRLVNARQFAEAMCLTEEEIEKNTKHYDKLRDFWWANPDKFLKHTGIDYRDEKYHAFHRKYKTEYGKALEYMDTNDGKPLSRVLLWKEFHIERYHWGSMLPSYIELHPEEFGDPEARELIDDFDYHTAYLRYNVERDVVETSKGTDLSIKDMKLAYAIYQRYGQESVAKSSGPHDFIHMNGRETLGRFTSIASINTKETFQFGCHRVPKSEWEPMLKQLGII